jgi:lipopolysaccharide export system permease protein
MPSFLVFTIPISALFATLLAFSRFSADSELIAMYACGASNKLLILPAAIFGLIAALLGIYFSTVLMPKGSMLAVNNLNKVLENLSVNDIRAKEMYDGIHGMVFYTNEKVDNANFNEILVVDTKHKAIISAQRGTIVPNSSRSLMMDFQGGKFTLADDKDNYTTLTFEQMLLNMPLNIDISVLPMSERFMKMSDLRNRFNESHIYRYEYVKRFSMPISTFILALFGVSLGMFNQRSGRSFGVVFACIAALGMNVMFIMGESFAAKYNPVLMGWLPLLVFSVILIPVMRRNVF